MESDKSLSSQEESSLSEEQDNPGSNDGLITKTNSKNSEKQDDTCVDVLVEAEDPQYLLYNIEDHPPIHIIILCGFQQALLVLSGSLSVSLVVSDAICARNDEGIKTQLLSSTLLMNGITTILMNLLGIRLPLFQSAAGDYLVPLLTMQFLDPDRCSRVQSLDAHANMTMSNTTGENDHSSIIFNNIRAFQGSLIAAGVIQFLVGATGLIGVLMRFIGPITIVPTIFLTGLFIVRATTKFAEVHWGISLTVAAVALILSLYLSKHKSPIPMWTRSKGFHIIWYPLHQVFSILIAMLFGWLLSAILTIADVLPNEPGNFARTDARSHIISEASWFRVPYPGQFGMFSFDVSVFVGFIIATITSILDSVGDYYACANMCGVPPPPRHGVNRGIAVEGLSSTISGLLGCGHATSTSGGNIGAIGVTRVASRDVFIAAGVIHIVFALIGKISAIFITIPYPVVGGALIVMFGMFNGVVLSNLQVVSLNSSRNLAIIGTSILFGLMIPYWIERNPNIILTGSVIADSIIKMLMGNPNLCGGVLACFLDNTVPGTLDERGISAWQSQIKTQDGDEKQEVVRDVYSLPLPKSIKRLRCLRYIPFMPKYPKTEY